MESVQHLGFIKTLLAFFLRYHGEPARHPMAQAVVGIVC